ncbi:histidine--tRNA ligase [Propylenella binzhouense]|uniref:Histidine--tRNA ligase n=1 Tax=Propylenella binzhouense TaxID=2555902 RepID=A0A964T1G7_9HYPH|nr:histidine--tRNA ligase [Propylenella binzhouense]MYZ46509.1 histidine--tRNA ligase [Propylenella binzhouense]
MAGPKKPNKLQPRLPRGFADRTPEDIRAVERMMATIRGVYERYGFEPVETPMIEYTDALGKFLPDQDRPNEGVFSFQDDDEQWLSLRYDLTAPLARYVAQNFEALPKPYRSYRAGWVFRNEKPGPGRFRQFMQFDADTVGAASVAADAEICMMAADTMEALGFQRGQYVIKVNNRKVLDGVMEAIGLGGEENAGRRLTVLRAIDKLDRLGIEGVRQLLGEGRKDESGDFTKGAGLDANQINQIDLFINARAHSAKVGLLKPDGGPASGDDQIVDQPSGHKFYPYSPRQIDHMLELFQDDPLLNSGLVDLRHISRFCRAAGYGTRRIQIDPSVVRGLEYYTGPVFEAQLTFEVPGEDGRPVVFGSVGGGGRYDGLVGRFRGENVPATGFSIGVSRLAAALKAIGKLGEEGASGPVVVTVMDRDRMADYQRMVADLRNAGLRAELYLGGSGMKAQLKYADRRNAPCAVIAGSDEFAAGRLQIKDLLAGKAQAADIADHETWREERPGQFEIAARDLVAEVRALIERQRSDL